MQKAGANEQRYNDFKESLTFLLNIEFKDLMAGKVDHGYEIHQELRQQLTQVWDNYKAIESLVDYYIKNKSELPA